MVSHINDTGFWMCKPYCSRSVRPTFATRSVIEASVARTRLGAALFMQRFS